MERTEQKMAKHTSAQEQELRDLHNSWPRKDAFESTHLRRS